MLAPRSAGRGRTCGPATLSKPMADQRSTPQPTRPENPKDQQPWRVEGSREGQGDQGGGKGPRFRFPRWLLWLALGLLAVNILLARQVPDDGGRESVPYSLFQDQVTAGNVTKVNAQGDIVQGEFKKEVDSPTDEDKSGEKKFETTLPTF